MRAPTHTFVLALVVVVCPALAHQVWIDGEGAASYGQFLELASHPNSSQRSCFRSSQTCAWAENWLPSADNRSSWDLANS